MKCVTKATIAVLMCVGVLLSFETQALGQCPCLTQYEASGTVVNSNILKGKIKATVAQAKVTKPGFKETTLANVDLSFDATAFGIDLFGGLQGTAARATASAGSGHSDGTAELLDVDLGLQVLYNLGITADLVRSEAHAVCTYPGSSTSGASELVNLMVDLDGPGPDAAVAVTVTGAPNQVIVLAGGGKLILNEQKIGGGTRPNIVVNALHLVVPNIADVVIASSYASVTCFCVPTS